MNQLNQLELELILSNVRKKKSLKGLRGKTGYHFNDWPIYIEFSGNDICKYNISWQPKAWQPKELLAKNFPIIRQTTKRRRPSEKRRLAKRKQIVTERKRS